MITQKLIDEGHAADQPVDWNKRCREFTRGIQLRQGYSAQTVTHSQVWFGVLAVIALVIVLTTLFWPRGHSTSYRPYTQANSK